MKKSKRDIDFIKQPIYKGGKDALKKKIVENLKYPKAALEAKIEGTVHVNYTIDKSGKVINARVIGGLGHGCDKEAIRLVKLLKFDVPKTRGLKLQFHKDIHIHFRLPKKKDPPKRTTQTVIQYTYAPSKNKKVSVGGYSINISSS